MFAAAPTAPGTKEQLPGAGYAPVYVPYSTGGGWVAPGYGLVQPAGGGPRVMVGPDGSVLDEVTETPPLPGTAPAPLAVKPADSGEGGVSGALLGVLALLALLVN